MVQTCKWSTEFGTKQTKTQSDVILHLKQKFPCNVTEKLCSSYNKRFQHMSHTFRFVFQKSGDNFKATEKIWKGAKRIDITLVTLVGCSPIVFDSSWSWVMMCSNRSVVSISSALSRITCVYFAYSVKLGQVIRSSLKVNHIMTRLGLITKQVR